MYCKIYNNGFNFNNKDHKRLYYRWYDMKRRCYDSRVKAFKNYGQRGISLCDEWHDFQNFFDWSVDNGFSIDKTIERIDNDGDYSPENCIWTNIFVQANNRRNNRCITLNGKTQSMMMWCKELGLSYWMVRSRKQNGWSDSDALLMPHSERSRPLVTFNGETKELSEWCRELCLSYSFISYRLSHGYSVKDALTLPSQKEARAKYLTIDGVKKKMADWCKELNIPYDLVWKRKRHGWSDERALFTPSRRCAKGGGMFDSRQESF